MRSPTALAVILYLIWMFLLVGVLVALRSWYTLSGQRKPNEFRPDGTGISPFSERLVRVHANCYEHFPILCGFLLLALATNETAVTDKLALVMIGARLIQSIIHLISTKPRAVVARFVFFMAQYFIAFWWAIGFFIIHGEILKDLIF